MNRKNVALISMLGLILLTGLLSRYLAIPFLITTWVSWWLYMRDDKYSWIYIASFAAMYLGVNLQPLDYRFHGFRDPPRVTRVVYGLPGQELKDRAKKGEITLGGCAVTWNDPRFLLVW